MHTRAGRSAMSLARRRTLASGAVMARDALPETPAIGDVERSRTGRIQAALCIAVFLAEAAGLDTRQIGFAYTCSPVEATSLAASPPECGWVASHRA